MVKEADEEKMWNVAPWMNRKWSGVSSSSSSPEPLWGEDKRGISISMGNLERLSPRSGCAGMVPRNVWNVRVVFQPDIYCEMRLRAFAEELASPKVAGSHKTRTTRFVLFPKVTSAFDTEARPIIESLLKIWILNDGIVAV